MDPFIAEIKLWPATFAPRGWAFCQGQLLPISSHTALFSLIGTIYGGDGRTTFALPDLRGRVPVGTGTGPGLSSYSIGSRGGAESVTLTPQQMPAHTHAATSVASASGDEATDASPQGNLPAANRQMPIYGSTGSTVELEAGAVTTTNANAGGSAAHPNVQPYIAMNYIIALVGIYPSRN